MVKVYYVQLSENINNDEIKHLIKYISKEKKEGLENLQCQIERKIKIYSEVALRIIINKYMKIQNKDIIFYKNQYGKPYLKGSSVLNFNLSHTRNSIAIAIATQPIGIDIEKIKVPNFKIARRFFTQREVDFIEELDIYAGVTRYNMKSIVEVN